MKDFSAILPILEEFRQRIEALENNTTEAKTVKTNDGNLDMTEIQDYLEKLHMA
jgi:hypothetical protein